MGNKLQNFKYCNKTPLNIKVSQYKIKNQSVPSSVFLKGDKFFLCLNHINFKTWILQMTMQTLQIPLNKIPAFKICFCFQFSFGHFTSKSSSVLLYCLDLFKIQKRVHSTS